MDLTFSMRPRDAACYVPIVVHAASEEGALGIYKMFARDLDSLAAEKIGSMRIRSAVKPVKATLIVAQKNAISVSRLIALYLEMVLVAAEKTFPMLTSNVGENVQSMPSAKQVKRVTLRSPIIATW